MSAVLDPDEQQSVTQLLVYLLPACNSDTLQRLLEFLSTVTDHAHDRQDRDGQEVGNGFRGGTWGLAKKNQKKSKSTNLRSSLWDAAAASG